jgi:uncharacterized protein (DUF433 family)
MNTRIEIRRDICHGKPCIKGTRIMVSNILNLLAHGASLDEVLQGYPQLARDDVFAALEYAEAIVRDEDIQPVFA